MREDLITPQWLAYARECIGRLEAIRDAFLTGRDSEAVRMICELDEYGDRRVLPLSSTSPILPAQAVHVIARPQLPFKVNRLCLAEECARDFLVIDVKLGNQSMFLQHGELAGSIASARARIDDLDPVPDKDGFWRIKLDRRLDDLFGVAIDVPVCAVGQELGVTVVNASGRESLLRGAFFGRLVLSGMPIVRHPAPEVEALSEPLATNSED